MIKKDLETILKYLKALPHNECVTVDKICQDTRLRPDEVFNAHIAYKNQRYFDYHPECCMINPHGRKYLEDLPSLRLKERTESRKDWKERNWFLIAVISFLAGVAFTKSLDQLISHLWQSPVKEKETISHSIIEPLKDSSKKNIPHQIDSLP